MIGRIPRLGDLLISHVMIYYLFEICVIYLNI